ncbi:hypothetical protein AAC03nite_37800 [Alicyclobacillus acidoterrestris]|nr:hypothetical protein AAC03nite_37800 [Alicyclobacillus acidoterrestris]
MLFQEFGLALSVQLKKLRALSIKNHGVDSLGPTHSLNGSSKSDSCEDSINCMSKNSESMFPL